MYYKALRTPQTAQHGVVTVSKPVYPWNQLQCKLMHLTCDELQQNVRKRIVFCLLIVKIF